MANYIDKQALLNEIAELHMKHKLPDNEEMLFTESDIRGLVACLPTADVAPVVHGKWIFKSRWHDSIDENLCSECGQLLTTAAEKKMNFCPNCGARMDLGGADNGE